MMDNVIEINDLSFGYGGEREVLSGVNCAIRANAFTVIMGNNGSGKSTLLRAMGGIVPYHKGSIKIKGKELKDLQPKDRAKEIGFLAQHHKAVFPFKVSEVVLTGRASYVHYLPKKEDVYEADKAMDRLGIMHLRDEVYSQLSGGQQQLVMIARLLTQNSNIILMDEPISALDYYNQINIIKVIKELVSQGITVAAILHDTNLSYLYADEVIYVHQKKAHEVEGEPWEHPLVKEIFRGDFNQLAYKDKCIFVPNL